MGDIITTFSKIGSQYLEDEKRVKNKAYEYDTIKVYLFDIETKTIEPHLNIKKEDLIYTDYGKSPRQGFLFPIAHLDTKDVDKMLRGIITANKNLLSYFSKNDIFKNPILQLIYGVNNIFFMKLMNLKFSTSCHQLTLFDYQYHWKEFKNIQSNFFENYKSKIVTLEKEKAPKGEKIATYFALSYKGCPVSTYFKNVYELHLEKDSEDHIKVYGYDMLSNEPSVGGDANLVFCSINELKISKKNILLKTIIQSKLLPLNIRNAQKVEIGFEVVKKFLTTNFYGLKMAIIPTLLASKDDIYKEVLKILTETLKHDNSLKNIEDYESYINDELEEIARKETNLPVLNTILFIDSPPASKKYDLLLQIDDVLPSYISHISDRMGYYNIKAFKNKDEKSPNEETIFMHNLFEDRLEIMSVLLSDRKIEKDILIHKFAELIYWGTMNKSYAHPVEWSKFFTGFYHKTGRTIEAIQRYVAFFNDTKKLKENFILQKERKLEEIYKADSSETKNSKRERNIKESFEKSVFVQQNEVLQTAYLLGMFSQSLINWQKGINQTKDSSYEKWLNNSGAITKDGLNRIWHNSDGALNRIKSKAGNGNHIVNYVREMLLEYMPNMMMYKGIVKSSEVSLSFAMGGSDYTKSTKIKEEK